jgi:hypothetical protein
MLLSRRNTYSTICHVKEGIFLTKIDAPSKKNLLTVFSIVQNNTFYQLPSCDFGDYIFILCSSCKQCINKYGIESIERLQRVVRILVKKQRHPISWMVSNCYLCQCSSSLVHVVWHELCMIEEQKL